MVEELAKLHDQHCHFGEGFVVAAVDLSADVSGIGQQTVTPTVTEFGRVTTHLQRVCNIGICIQLRTGSIPPLIYLKKDTPKRKRQFPPFWMQEVWRETGKEMTSILSNAGKVTVN